MPSLDGIDDDVPPKGYGVFAASNTGGYGVLAANNSNTNAAVEGRNANSVGVLGTSSTWVGVFGTSYGGPNSYGMYGTNTEGVGMYGVSENSTGVIGRTHRQTDGVSFGVVGNARYTPQGVGVYGVSENVTGVLGYSIYGDGVSGEAFRVRPDGSTNFGVVGFGWRTNGGVGGGSMYGPGVTGFSGTADGVVGESRGRGVAGVLGLNTYTGQDGGGYGVIAASHRGIALYCVSPGLAAYLEGNVRVTGTLYKNGLAFKIDHPLDPANKYLHHSSVESPDMKNVYDGVVVLDDKGEAEIELPDWFGAVNKHFRYQLTAIGAPGPNLYIAEEISDGVTTTNYSRTSSNKNKNSRFKIAGGTSGMKVSWQVTGIRKDPWANAHRIPVEEDKPDKERG